MRAHTTIRCSCGRPSALPGDTLSPGAPECPWCWAERAPGIAAAYLADPESPGAQRFGTYRLSDRDMLRLSGIHPDLMAVVQYAIRVTPVPFGIPSTGGVRTPEMQARLIAVGKSSPNLKNPRHMTGHAVDIYAIVGGKPSWAPVHVIPVHDAFVRAGVALSVPLRWGGDWDGDGEIRERGENDLVHHELPIRAYGNNHASQSPAAAAFLVSLAA